MASSPVNDTDVLPGVTDAVASVAPSKAASIFSVPPVAVDGDKVAVIVTGWVDSTGSWLEESAIEVPIPTVTVAGALSLASHSSNGPNLATIVCVPLARSSSIDASPFPSSGAGSPPPSSMTNMAAGMKPFVESGAGRTWAVTVNVPYWVPEGTSNVVVVPVAPRTAV